MFCQPALEKYYDLKLLKLDRQPIDEAIQKVASKHQAEIRNIRTENRLWKNMFDVTPFLIDTLEEEGKEHIRIVKDPKNPYGYLYLVAKHAAHWYNAPRFDFTSFPLMRDRRNVLKRVTKMARTLSKENTSEYDATCLYLLYFYALLVNPTLNWITVDYLANGNRYHQYGTLLKGHMKFETTFRYV